MRTNVTRFAWAAVVLAVAGLSVPAARGQDAAEKVKQTQSKLLAKRAAQADAYRNLAEQVKGLHITSTTFVKDFVAENDEIATAVHTFLRGAKVTDTRYMEDGSAEVTMELPLQVIEAELTKIYKASYKGDKYKINDFQDLHVTNKIEKITVTGNGAPRAIGVEEYDNEGKPVPGRSLSLPPSWKNVPARARLMAKRAATLDAYRNLSEQVMGLHISSNTFVKDFVAENDEIRTHLNTFLKGAKVGEVRYLDDLSVEVDVKLPLQTVITTLRRECEAYYKGSKVQVRDFEDMKQTVKIDWVSATGTGLPPEKYLGGEESTAQVSAGPGAPDWARNTATAKGNGIKPADAISDAQGRLLALRAAKLDAMRNLTEQIHGLAIDSHTHVKDFIATDDRIRTAIDSYLTGVKTVSEDYNAESGEATVGIEAPLDPLWNIVVKYRKEVRTHSTIENQ
jgi:hypothetical protein